MEQYKDITEINYPSAFTWYSQDIKTKTHEIFNNWDINNQNPIELCPKTNYNYEENLIYIQSRIIANYKIHKILKK